MKKPLKKRKDGRISEEENSKSRHTKREGSSCFVFPQKIVFADHGTVRKMEQGKIKKYQNNWAQVNLTKHYFCPSYKCFLEILQTVILSFLYQISWIIYLCKCRTGDATLTDTLWDTCILMRNWLFIHKQK